MDGIFSKRRALCILAASFAMVIGLRGMESKNGDGSAPAEEEQAVEQLVLPINLEEMSPRVSALVERLKASGADFATLRDACVEILRATDPVMEYLSAHATDRPDLGALLEALGMTRRTLDTSINPQGSAVVDLQAVGDGLAKLLQDLSQINGAITSVKQEEVSPPPAPGPVIKHSRITRCKVLTVTLSVGVAALAVVAAGIRAGWWHLGFIPGLYPI